MSSVPNSSVRGVRHLVAAADQQAARAGDVVFERGGNAVDAAIATNAAIAVTGPHLCGMGGDLFALIHVDGEVMALNASGRAGALVSAEALRARGHTTVPLRHEPAAVTVPGCVDGWCALHARFGSLPFDAVLAPAIDLAESGFPASPLLVVSLARLDERARSNLGELVAQATRVGATIVRPGVGRALRSVATGGREAFYGGEFGEGLLSVGRDVFAPGDLDVAQAEWVDPVSARMFGVDVHTIGPNSQGYLTLAGGAIADTVALPDDPDDEHAAHLLIEAAKLAGYDRPDVLFDGANGGELIEAARSRAGLLDRERASNYAITAGAGDTTYLCTSEVGGMAVSLIQSNASGFGSWLAEPNTGINLHDRGLGFSLVPGHPAELAPGRRPPHTLSPALATSGTDLAAVFGTMGGDAQPQILLQVAARLFLHGQSPATAIAAGRWALAGPATGFDTWDDMAAQTVEVEGHAPAVWDDALARRGHRVRRLPPFDSAFGHAHTIVATDGGLAGAADARCRIGAVIGR